MLGTKVGRLVAAEFADQARLACLGSSRFIRFGATRGPQIRRPTAEKLVAAARDALPMPDAAVARAVLAADLALLADLDAQIDAATAQLLRLVPRSPFGPLQSVKGWGAVRVGNYGGALGDLTRFTNTRQVYRTAGLNPIQYESAGRRRDSVISREGSVQLRRALIDLGLGLWLSDPAAKQYAAGLRARGKKGGVIACAMAHGAPRQSNRLRPRPRHLRPGPLDLRRLRQPFTTPAGSATLECTKDPDQTPPRLWQTHNGHAATSLAPGSFAMRQPERGQTTRPCLRSHTSAWAPGTPHRQPPANNINNSAERSR